MFDSAVRMRRALECYSAILILFYKYLPGCEINCPTAEEIVYTIKERRYYDSIERAHTYASKLLLDLLLEDKQLMHRIRSAWMLD